MNKEEIKAVEKLKETQDSYLKDELDYAIEAVFKLIKKQEKIIDKMAEYMEDELYVDDFCNRENCYADEYINGHCNKCLNCIKEYFKKEVEKEKS